MAENQKTYLFLTTPLDKNTRKFLLVNLEGEEGISELFLYRLTISTEDNNINMSKLLGEKITAVIEFYNGKKRFINGVVTRLIQAGNDHRHTTYYAEIRPWLWELSLVSDNKIFQNKSVSDIIKEVFRSNGFSDFQNKTNGNYPELEYCVQYMETSLDFVHRLMEEEGIFYYFEHSSQKHTLILADDMDVHKNCEGLEKAKMKITSTENDESITSCSLEKQLTSTSVSLNDYNFETPATKLLTKADSGNKPVYKVYDYPGKYSTESDGQTLAKIRSQQHTASSNLLKGTGNCRAFIAGYKFKLSGHDRKDINKDYVIGKLKIQVDQTTYSNSFTAFPSTVQFRPLPVTKKPKIYGTQTALVVGKSGEEIWTDEYGRIKVQFHWDREGKKDENSSCWIRVAQIWAGKNWGTLFTPRIGAEVIVSFLEGDPDKPIVTGTVYNGSQKVPYKLPSKKNISTFKTRSTKKGKAGNELRFDDTKDSEEIYIHAQKDMNQVIENERTVTINKSNDSLTIKEGDRAIKIEKGKETYEVKDTREVTVTGNETHNNKANFTHNVKGNYSLNIDGNFTIKVKGSISVKSDMDISTKAGTSISTKAGTSISNKAGTTFNNKASVSMTNDGGAQLTDKASAMVKIDGGGMVQAKGGIIKLN